MASGKAAVSGSASCHASRSNPTGHVEAGRYAARRFWEARCPEREEPLIGCRKSAPSGRDMRGLASRRAGIRATSTVAPVPFRPERTTRGATEGRQVEIGRLLCDDSRAEDRIRRLREG